ncbi:nitroreductase family deazaflavin-dependent oxidoreductase [Protaetiibacter intestinalis]|uniref:Nitroreductase family deazaflavin-dependent oxidoreductase n=1 Tax=Protaetiibacter intestinalis TaxID=2419774 RepID=A0A387B6I3_9MICO|nr:nitroreductase family deazaflavin-dependent oxidoreductase [Protaetiibacter intestinalis]AYF97358.1 nitroreductase family deazaflavin-dependent oxidoreductase [Protaetiibacter intestinalis]
MSGFNERIVDEFRSNAGTVETAGFGRSLVLLHHLGAKSGVERVTPVLGIPSERGWLIAASKGGSPENPAWFHNLHAHPDVVIETPDEGEVAVTAVELQGAERDAAWARFLARGPAFAQYEQRTARTIPVVELRRR